MLRAVVAVGVFALPIATVGCQAGVQRSAAPVSRSPAPVSASPAPGPTPREAAGSGSANALSSQDRLLLNARLIDAAMDNDVDRAKRLIQSGADVNAKDDAGQSAFLIAASEGYLRLLKFTLRTGADVHSMDSVDGTALIRAAERGHAHIVARLLSTDIDVNHASKLGYTALNQAIALGNGNARYVDTVRLLVVEGANINRPSRGVLPVERARSYGFEKITAVLERVSQSANLRRPEANHLLLQSARTGDNDGAVVALRAGARMDIVGPERRTPLQLAMQNSHKQLTRLLTYLAENTPPRPAEAPRGHERLAARGGHLRTVDRSSVRKHVTVGIRAHAGIRRIQLALNDEYNAGLLADGRWGEGTGQAWLGHERLMGLEHPNSRPHQHSLAVLGRGRFRVVQ